MPAARLILLKAALVINIIIIIIIIITAEAAMSLQTHNSSATQNTQLSLTSCHSDTVRLYSVPQTDDQQSRTRDRGTPGSSPRQTYSEISPTNLHTTLYIVSLHKT